MSWDYNEHTKPCQCGKGLIKVVDGSNDWGQTSHDETILCPECKEKADKAKALKEERMRIANGKISLVISYFKENYTHLLEDIFLHTRSKKAVWQIAYDLGIEDCSLTKFYKYYRDKDEYIKELICWYRIGSIINALKIKDQKLSELFQDAKAHIKEFDDEWAAASYMHIKGR
ncbi:hypothetical protein [Mariniplasma anaerobium]|uniref:Uncharacterized protein n=1 Tax=Mariniplasma anaerobium TaxID=2735436 RepID=A0A7U9TGU1_9MOLU|nr:hypothetical protein [Mariniplasma anaerobium]BCR36407.1 hypothetical protein MPAN_013000 [Mariniplasma anaerobium]